MNTQAAKRMLATCTCAALLAGASPAWAEGVASRDDGVGMVADLLLVRPVSLVGSVLGAAVFLVSLPFTLTTQSTDEAARELLGKPLEYTFYRPLGDFDHCGADRRGCGSF
ncbi:MAG: hypothetical protein RBS40_02490 [Rhodocyclaceae bacterium]|jgi:hypothetical protein|nr:hypothetical protein [Rhodocyclaceae bacterium]